MEKNKITIRLCYIELIIFAGILVTMIFHFRCGFEKSFFALMIIAALVGCGVSLALKDYLKSMIQSSAFDVAGVHNKKALEKQLQQIQDEDDTLDTGIMMFDLNNLKIINDTYGHECGDMVLKSISNIFKKNMEEKGLVSRWGGEEFLLVFELPLAQAQEKLEQIADEIRETAFAYEGETFSVSLTFGLTDVTGERSLDEIVKEADDLLYRGKAEGRNRIVTSGDRKE